MPANTRIKNQRAPVLLPSTIGALIPNWTWPRAYYRPGYRPTADSASAVHYKLAYFKSMKLLIQPQKCRPPSKSQNHLCARCPAVGRPSTASGV